MFERLGGVPAQPLARAFWTRPCAETRASYNAVCKPPCESKPPSDPLTPVQDALDGAAARPPHWVQLERFAGRGPGVWHNDADAAFAVLRRFISG